MGEVGEGKSVSYAAIVSPTATVSLGVAAEPEPVREAEIKAHQEDPHPMDDDLEGFQEVTSKKEKVRDREKPRQRKKKPGSSRKSREAKEGSHEHGDEQQSSKEVTPEKDDAGKEEIEYVPAPPPKTNPWKKPVTESASGTSLKDTSQPKVEEKSQVTEKLKVEKPKPRQVVESKQQPVSKSNPWKKLEKSTKAVDEDVEKKENKGQNSTTWPTLALKPNSKGGKKKEGGEGGPIASLDEGKENQVCEFWGCWVNHYYQLLKYVPFFQDTSNYNNNHLKSNNNDNNTNNADDAKKRRRRGKGVGKSVVE